MATARQLNNLPATVNITIPASGIIPNSQGFLWVDDDTSIEWTNNTTEEVQIVFTIGGLDTIIIPGNGGVGGPISASEAAVNYQLEDANGNPISSVPYRYCVQWGDGALQVSVSANSLAFNVSVPASVSLATTGNLQFTSDAEYGVNWKDNAGKTTVWSPQPADIEAEQNGINPNDPQGALTTAASPATCTFTAAGIDVPGKGTVYIGG
jgi:hypothetical protein